MEKSQTRYFGYLRVSTESQEVESQKVGLLEYANRNGFAPVEIIAEKVSRRMKWNDRELGRILDNAKPGDVLLTSEFTRLAGSPGQVFGFLEAAANKGIIVHITKSNITMDGGINSTIMATVFSIASMIELDFITKRTKEGLQRAKLEGKRLGRPPGSTGFSKLAGQDEEILKYLAIGLPKNKLAKLLDVSYPTLKSYIKAKKLEKNRSKNKFRGRETFLTS